MVKKTQRSHRSVGIRAVLIAGCAVVLAGVATPAAQAASYQYVSHVNTAEGQTHYSGLLADLNGGQSTTYGTNVTNHIVSYSPYPGYIEYGHAYSNAYAVLSHPNVTNAYSKCYWLAAGNGGSIDMSCWAYW